jgi:hypothetical protein
MKKLLSIALLVSAFSVVPAFAMESEGQSPESRPEKAESKKTEKGSYCPFTKLAEYPIFNEIHGLHKPRTAASNYVNFVKTLFTTHLGKTLVTLALIKVAYDNVDDILAKLGVGEEEAVEGEAFADASACGCENADNAENAANPEEQKEEACELKKKEAN